MWIFMVIINLLRTPSFSFPFFIFLFLFQIYFYPTHSFVDWGSVPFNLKATTQWKMKKKKTEITTRENFYYIWSQSLGCSKHVKHCNVMKNNIISLSSKLRVDVIFTAVSIYFFFFCLFLRVVLFFGIHCFLSLFMRPFHHNSTTNLAWGG